MQRIIAFTAYLENTYRHLSKELNQEADPALLSFTNNLNEIEKGGYMINISTYIFQLVSKVLLFYNWLLISYKKSKLIV